MTSQPRLLRVTLSWSSAGRVGRAVQTGNTPPGNGEIGCENRVVERRGKVDGGGREKMVKEGGWRISFAGSTSPCDSVSSRSPAIRLYRFVNRSIKGDVHLYALLGKIYERCRGRGPKV